MGQTAVYQIEFKDGRIFRVFTANRTQELKAIRSFNNMSDKIKSIKTLVNGIHTFKQWSKIIETI